MLLTNIFSQILLVNLWLQSDYLVIPFFSSELLDNSWKENESFGGATIQPIPHLTTPQLKFLEGVTRPAQNNPTLAGYNAARSDFDSEFDNLVRFLKNHARS